MAERFAGGGALATATNEDSTGFGMVEEGGENQGLMVDALVCFGALELAIEQESLRVEGGVSARKVEVEGRERESKRTLPKGPLRTSSTSWNSLTCLSNRVHGKGKL